MSLERIETERLILRPLTRADAEAVFEWAGDPYSTHYMAWPCHKNLDETRSILADFERKAQSQAPQLDRPLGIQLKSTGELMGSTGLHQNGPDSVASGWILAPQYRGRRYASESAWALFATAFAELPWLQAIHAAVHPLNHVSLGMAVKLGFRPWGSVRHDFPQQHLRDFEVPLYRLLRP